jgi:hypothetical protein
MEKAEGISKNWSSKKLLPVPALVPPNFVLEKNLNHPRNHVGDTVRCSLYVVLFRLRVNRVAS